MNETIIEKNPENNLINDYIDIDTVLKVINDSLTRNNDEVVIVNENADVNFNVVLHYNIQCVTANDVNSGLYDTVKYLMDHVIKHFTNECSFKRYVILYIANFIMKIAQLTTTSFKTPTRNAQIIM